MLILLDFHASTAGTRDMLLRIAKLKVAILSTACSLA